MKKQYVIARYFRGWYAATVCEPTTKKRMLKSDAQNFKKKPPL